MTKLDKCLKLPFLKFITGTVTMKFQATSNRLMVILLSFITCLPHCNLLKKWAERFCQFMILEKDGFLTQPQVKNKKLLFTTSKEPTFQLRGCLEVWDTEKAQWALTLTSLSQETELILSEILDCWSFITGKTGSDKLQFMITFQSLLRLESKEPKMLNLRQTAISVRWQFLWTWLVSMMTQMELLLVWLSQLWLDVLL